ncbi:CGNR zinc finger domain-containing protein [Streptomyces peucetius]|uniref:CGNR zinc finger domain-containing protein n=1 Tax=Streptomyces peucetius TaxID=1950 RepID=A0ABY6IAM9_STRPE|nr:CGNR zinc finger domain-containing protein [Streptomyces peucetius]UYQ63759.1 CGNR zinc finger domain-containing protein [Streptomyces peucetius]
METTYTGYVTKSATDTPGLLLEPPSGGSFRFDPGALCLELLTTGGPGRLAAYEVLHDPAALLRWVADSRLSAGLQLDADDAGVAGARVLRHALWRMAAARAHGGDTDPADVAVVNEAAAAPPLAARIGADGSRQWAPGGATVTQLLSTVARDAVDLFTGPHAHRIRECGSHDCGLLFVDTSRPGRRRWCSMERCGNRNKVRAHRARLPGGEGGEGGEG